MKRTIVNYFSFLLLTGVCTALFAGLWNMHASFPFQQKKVYTILLDEEGFRPPRLSIHIGDTVRFRTVRRISFWPASDFHPTHTLYPEFDPKKPIGPRQSWNFTFQKSGIWNYHDHLDPSLSGTVVVNEFNHPLITAIQSADCTVLSGTDQLRCWQEEVLKVLERQGVDEAMKKVAILYTKNPLFGSYCHEFMHPIGAAAYKLARNNKDVAVPANMSICSFGFYHGYVEAMLSHGFHPEEAKKLCDSLSRSLQSQGVAAVGSCYHGLGHGFAEIHEPVTDYDIPLLLKKSIVLCHDVVNDPVLSQNCYAGVFNVVSNYFIKNTKTSLFSVQHPFALCLPQQEEYRQCYPYMALALMQRNGGDYGSMALQMTSLTDEQQTVVVEAISYKRGVEYVNSPSIEEEATWCNIFGQAQRHTCMIGYLHGMIVYGEPKLEQKQMVKFCTSKRLDFDSQKECIAEGIRFLSVNYPLAHMETVCHFLDSKFIRLCSDILQKKEK